MNRNRLALRLALIAIMIVIFFARGYQHNPQFVKGFGLALAFAAIVTIFRAVMESKQRKNQEEAKQLAAGSKNVDLFTKPKDF